MLSFCSVVNNEFISQTGLVLMLRVLNLSQLAITVIIFFRLSIQPATSLEAQWRICSQGHGTWREWMINTAGNTPADLKTMTCQQSHNLYAPALPLRYRRNKHEDSFLLHIITSLINQRNSPCRSVNAVDDQQMVETDDGNPCGEMGLTLRCCLSCICGLYQLWSYIYSFVHCTHQVNPELSINIIH